MWTERDKSLRLTLFWVEAPTAWDLNGPNFRCRYRLEYRREFGIDGDMQLLVLRIIYEQTRQIMEALGQALSGSSRFLRLF